MGTPAGLLFAAVVVLLSVAGGSADWDSDDDPVSTVQVDGVLGRSVSLPCDIEPATRDDRVYMVLWFKENAGKPMYSFDVRGRPFNQALYWSDAKSPGPRAYFATSSRPASLTLETVQLDNEGTYRCRVDFKDSPTRNSVVNLTVIVPPYQLFIYDNSGRPLVSAVVGPLTEGAALTLSCEVRGGKPPPTVSWFVNDKMADAAVVQMGRGVAVSKLEVGGVGRSDLNSTFKCQASNTKLVLPVEKSVRLELYLRPLSVVLADRPASLEAGLEAALACEAAGSRPPAQVTWWRDARSLRRGKLETTASETLVTSVLRFAPSPDDDGHVIKCHAENPSIPGSGLEDSLTLSVVYAPLVALRLGNTLNSADIKEGDDVYFECDVRANPREHKIAWRHDGRAVTQNVTSGVILSTRSLVLQGVTRQSGGSYACSAANGRGETASEPVALRVQYAPVCDSSEVSVIGASLGEALRVRCRVSADPGDVLFEWQFNNSGESISVPAARFASGNSSGGASSVSELNYAPTTDRDYGTLACWARNAIGRQAEPCVFQVVSAARPSPPRNCSLRAATNHSGAAAEVSEPLEVLEVECLAGYDGGLPQTFLLEAYESRSMRLRLNVSSGEASFRVPLHELRPARTPTLHLVVFAANAKGRSEPAVLEDITLRDAEKRTELAGLDDAMGLGMVPLAAALTGAVLMLGMAVLVAAVLTARRRHLGGGAGPGGGLFAHQLDRDAVKQKPPPGAGAGGGSMLEINHGDQRYVVSYTLKPATDWDRQPDILNPPSGAEMDATARPARRPTVLFPGPGSCASKRHSALLASYATPSPERHDAPASCTAGSGALAKSLVISNTIPGPESCV